MLHPFHIDCPYGTGSEGCMHGKRVCMVSNKEENLFIVLPYTLTLVTGN